MAGWLAVPVSGAPPESIASMLAADMPDVPCVIAECEPVCDAHTRSVPTRLKWAMKTIVHSPMKRLQAVRRIPDSNDGP
ncbi:MAG: hypothetical protein JWM41_461 [Gemmatimonadetes bacterium]|nr:hypothetical protein [Gemmatimonadota bacterium]